MALTTDSLASQGDNAIPNPLDQFQTFNCLYTLACMTPNQQNNGEMDKGSINNIICRSQGDWAEDRANKRVQTEFGSYDYFIDDVIIVSIPAASEKTGNSFATKISFKVIEPYSMGLFFMAMQQGSKQAGYSLNFREAPYMFMVEFMGYIDGEPSSDPDSKLTRYIPIKFINIKFQVTASGSMYECEAIPYNECAFRDNVIKVSTDVKITGENVKEILAEGASSLQNQLFQKAQNDTHMGTQGDLVVIVFPEDWTQVTGSDNKISKAKIYEDLSANGTVPFKDMKDIWIEGKEITQSSALQIDEKRNWHFTQEVTILDIITEVILRSHYITDQITGTTFQTDDNGMIDWFRVETKVVDGDPNPKLGRQQRTYYYRVVPYKVHIHKFLPPGVKPPGYESLQKEVKKVYNYIYTGKNTEVIKVDINFDMAFFAPLPSDYSENVGQENWNQGGLLASGKDIYYQFPETAQSGSAAEAVGIPQTPQGQFGDFGGLTLNSNAGNGRSIQNFLVTGQTQQGGGEDFLSVTAQSALRQFQSKAAGGSGTDDSKTSQVRNYQAMLTNDADMVQLNLEIMGDPYYIPSSGMGNQQGNRESFNSLDDGSMNYQDGEVDIIINFRTPIDLDLETGLYKFEKTVDTWSGLYQVIEVESKFQQNKFTQKIRANRLRTQVGGSSEKVPAIIESGSSEQQGGGGGAGAGGAGGFLGS